LQPAAITIEPAVAEVLSRLEALDGVECARMSGSGATCFAIFVTPSAAARGARAIKAASPGWWVRATILR
jgi:4-diphosphocytidyl-2-C-methyl-D-erythritol kinase